MRADPGEDDLDPTADLPDLKDRCPDALVGVERLSGDLLAPRQDRLGGPERHGGRGPLEAAHDPRHHQPDLLLELVVDRIPLRFADLLDDDLLGRLSADPARQFRSVDLDAVAGAMDAAVGPIDGHLHIRGFAILTRQGGDERCFDRLEDDLLVDFLVAMDRIDDAEDFFRLHGCLGRRSRRTGSCSVVVDLPPYHPREGWRLALILQMSALARDRPPTGPHPPGGMSHQRHVDPTLAAQNPVRQHRRHHDPRNAAKRPTPHTNWSPAERHDPPGKPSLRTAPPSGAPDSSSHLHEAQPGRVGGGETTVKEPPSAPRGREGATAPAGATAGAVTHRDSNRRSPPHQPAPEG